jgi:hypothetical protein
LGARRCVLIDRQNDQHHAQATVVAQATPRQKAGSTKMAAGILIATPQ